MTTPERFKLIIQTMPKYEAMPRSPTTGIQRLRQCLKYLRRNGLRCISCTTIIPPKKDGS